MNIPSNLLFAPTHEWLRLDGEIGTVGISDHAQHELTDVVYAELPVVGKSVRAGDQVCVVESVKAASDIYSPVDGVIETVNDALGSDPGLINSDPYGAGWIFKVRVAPQADHSSLLDAEKYASHLGS